jgi:hypothetical protein
MRPVFPGTTERRDERAARSGPGTQECVSRVGRKAQLCHGVSSESH